MFQVGVGCPCRGGRRKKPLEGRCVRGTCYVIRLLFSECNFLSVSGNTSCALSCAWLKQTDFFLSRGEFKTVANSKLHAVKGTSGW